MGRPSTQTKWKWQEMARSAIQIFQVAVSLPQEISVNYEESIKIVKAIFLSRESNGVNLRIPGEAKVLGWNEY